MKTKDKIAGASPYVLPPLPFGEDALEPGDLGEHHRLPLWQASQGICR